MATNLYLLRHGEAKANIERYFNGFTDGELTENGIVQANLAALRLRHTHIDTVYTSDLQRTINTAKPVCKLLGISHETVYDLREINGGEWEGLMWDQLPSLYPVEYENWDVRPHLFEAPKGEKMKDFSDRCVKAIENIIKKHEGETVLVVTHGTAIRVLMRYFYGLPWDRLCCVKWCDNAAISQIQCDAGKFTVLLDGDNSHLGDRGTIYKQDWIKQVQYSQ
jgi:broad specificity phosphatase PhoE